MPRPLNDTGCGDCCVIPAECGECGVSCVPRYLCVHVGVIPNGDINPCCTEMNFRLQGGCLWTGGGHCDLYENINLQVQVELLPQGDGTCNTRLTDGTGTDITNTGVDYSFTYSTTNADGHQFNVVVQGGTGGLGVPNPLFSRPCAPCHCASCLPPKLCFTLRLLDDVCGLGCDNFQKTITLTWDAIREGYYGDDIPCGEDVFSVYLYVPDCDEYQTGFGCALLGVLTGPRIYKAEPLPGQIDPFRCGNPNGCMDFKIDLEMFDDDEPIVGRHGYVCRDGRVDGPKIGEEPFEIWRVLPLEKTFEIRDEHLALFGYFTISDGMCGDCASEKSNCESSCPELAPRLGLNLFPCPPVKLIGEFVAPGCEWDGLLFELDSNVSTTFIGHEPSGGSCVQFSQASPSLFSCQNGHDFNFQFKLWDTKKANCDDPDGCANYELAYVFSGVSCNPADPTYSGQITPNSCQCVPFLAEFTLPQICWWDIDPMTGLMAPGEMCGNCGSTYKIRIYQS